MTFNEIQELIKLVNKSNLTEFKMKDGEFELSIRTKKYDKQKDKKATTPQQQIISVPPVQQPYAPPVQPAASATPAPKGESEETKPELENEENQENNNYIPIKSPIVGTFYRSPSPEKPPYIKVGDPVEVGAVVCIVEAMKLFNEIESEIAGKVVKVVVEDAQPVEYDQVLFLVDPNG